MADRVPRKQHTQLTPEERAKRDARMAAALRSGINDQDFIARFGPGSRKEIPRIVHSFRISRMGQRPWAS